MKKNQFRVFAMMIMALVCVGFTSCGGDDDDNSNSSSGNNISASVDGIWYLKSEKWYDWEDGKADMSKAPSEKTYQDNSHTWEFSTKDKTIIERRSGEERGRWAEVGSNEYRNRNGAGRDRVVIKTVTANSMTIELYDGYYGEGGTTGNTSEFGILTFSR